MQYLDKDHQSCRLGVRPDKMCEKVLAIQDVELLLMRMNKDFDSIH
jgi:hypothetical protein